jgi:hypothetical protein
MEGIEEKIIEALKEYEGTDFIVTDALIEFIEEVVRRAYTVDDHEIKSFHEKKGEDYFLTH